MKFSKYIAPLFLLLIFSCQQSSNDKDALIKQDVIDQYLENLINIHAIPGMAVAIIKNGKTIHQGYYGKLSLETGESISPNTTFKIFSLTKTNVALAIFKLVEENKFGLEDKLSEHFEGLPQKWQNVEIGNLLSHSSGLPDVMHHMDEFLDESISDREFIKLLYDDKFDFETGHYWSYNQTNYILLRMLIEKITGTPFEKYILKHQFPNSDPKNVFFSSLPNEEIPNRAKYYDFDKGLNEYRPKQEFSGDKNLPLAGLNITLDEYITWNNRLDNDKIIEPDTKSRMWVPFEFKESDRRFTYGWDIYPVNGFNSYGFSGGSVSGFRKFVEKDLTIIVLTTGYKNYALQDIIIDQLVGIVDESLRDKNVMLRERIMEEYFLLEKPSKTENILEDLKASYPEQDFEEVLTTIGLTLFFEMDKKQEAIELMKINLLEHPDSADLHGSLGYMYLLTKKYEKAKESYQKADDLNPQNTYSKRRIKEIDRILSEQRI